MSVNTDLQELSEDPDQLLKYGFEREEEETTDPNRWVWYRKVIQSSESQLRLELELEFELSISDDPFANFSENRQYLWNGCYLRAYDRQMERENNMFFNEATENPVEVDRILLNINHLAELLKFAELLGSGSARFTPLLG